MLRIFHLEIRVDAEKEFGLFSPWSCLYCLLSESLNHFFFQLIWSTLLTFPLLDHFLWVLYCLPVKCFDVLEASKFYDDIRYHKKFKGRILDSFACSHLSAVLLVECAGDVFEEIFWPTALTKGRHRQWICQAGTGEGDGSKSLRGHQRHRLLPQVGHLNSKNLIRQIPSKERRVRPPPKSIGNTGHKVRSAQPVTLASFLSRGFWWTGQTDSGRCALTRLRWRVQCLNVRRRA